MMLTAATATTVLVALAGAGKSHTMAGFARLRTTFGKVEGSDELRRPVPLHENDVLVLDEASQLSTTDLALLQEAARQAGSGRVRVIGRTLAGHERRPDRPGLPGRLDGISAPESIR